MDQRTSRRLAAGTMTGAATLAIAGFTALGSVFDYPDVLQSPTATILASYREHETAVAGWFLVLTISAALLAPTAVLLGRLSGRRLGRWIAGVGIAAAAVQVIGLSRWVLFVPGISDDALVPNRAADAHDRFELLHTWLGEAVGETLGYALTATFTVLVVRGVTSRIAPWWLSLAGIGSAALIATGVLIPLDVPGADFANFVGYVVWTLWLIAMAAALWRSAPATASADVGATADLQRVARTA